MTVQIVLNQSGKPAGVAGQAREDFALGVPVALSMAGGPFISQQWSILAKPPNASFTAVSAAALSAPAAAASNLTPIDNTGTYFVQVSVDAGFGLGARTEDVARITFYAGPALGAMGAQPRRIPAFQETIEHNVVNALFPAGNPWGWATEMIRWFSLFGSIVVGSTQMIAGAGLTGGGDLTADRTFNVAAGDGSIVVSADSIAVGVISDAQHGNRGGGLLHAPASNLAAGFAPTISGPNRVLMSVDGNTPVWQAVGDAQISGVNWSKVGGTPTTLGGYGITDGLSSSRVLNAGAGLTGGGNLTADRTFNVAAADGTIVVNADNIQVGVVANANISDLAWGKLTGVPNTVGGFGITDAALNTRLLTAGAGLTGGGNLTADRTFNVVAANGSIVVTADDISVGVITDAMHGNRAGGALHPAVTNLAAGFASNITGTNFVFMSVDGLTPTWAQISDAQVLNVNWSKIVGHPTTLGGYGITDAVGGAGSIAATAPLVATGTFGAGVAMQIANGAPFQVITAAASTGIAGWGALNVTQSAAITGLGTAGQVPFVAASALAFSAGMSFNPAAGGKLTLAALQLGTLVSTVLAVDAGGNVVAAPGGGSGTGFPTQYYATVAIAEAASIAGLPEHCRCIVTEFAPGVDVFVLITTGTDEAGVAIPAETTNRPYLVLSTPSPNTAKWIRLP